ncbi:histidinol-phosphate transaminase [Gloeobacter morelensis]|uniref:Histidinol-phosphate aminotransferase n=1 Tax=Gloeobacter morelensis MG652769 TaxID=2781736 RepID=A0ABY3PJT2_9CYAN|nr:histidinol-phosphate transaminase [Gloeobacter morelensis]UFP93925.1 histidinol-phosphate transaminase [Gloeobacter morelensis MG652769]
MQPYLRPDLDRLQAYHTPHFPEADKLDANELPHDLPEWLKNKLAFLLEQGVRTNRYPEGDPLALKAAIAEYCGVTSDMVCVGNGSDELIRSLITATCLGDRGTVASAEPTFSMYRILAETLAVPYVGVARTADYGVDADALEAAIQANGTRVLFLANPNSPTGNLLSDETSERLGSLPVLVVLDEAYYEFSRFSAVPLLWEWPNLVILRTFSKAFRLANFRVGYALANPEIAAVLEKVRLPYNLPGLSQLAAFAALEHRDVLLAAVPEILAERRRIERFLADFEQIELFPSDANFLFVRPRTADPEAVRVALAGRGSLVRSAAGGLRITVGTPEQNDRLIANVAALFTPEMR